MSMRDGSEDVFVMRPDGSGVANLTRTPDLEESHPAWSPSGELTFSRHGESGPIELWSMSVTGDDAPASEHRGRNRSSSTTGLRRVET